MSATLNPTKFSLRILRYEPGETRGTGKSLDFSPERGESATVIYGRVNAALIAMAPQERTDPARDFSERVLHHRVTVHLATHYSEDDKAPAASVSEIYVVHREELADACYQGGIAILAEAKRQFVDGAEVSLNSEVGS